MRPSEKLIKSTQSAADLVYKENYTLYFGVSEKGIGTEPIFSKKDDSQFKCLQEKVIAIYVIRQCVRHLMISYNYLNASHLVYAEKHLSPSAILSYNSCYHAAKCFMALKGDLSFQVILFEDKRFNARESFKFHFKEKQSKWHSDYIRFEENHTKFWNYFSEYFKSQSPSEYFYPLFKYWFPRKFIGEKTEKDFTNKSDFLIYTLKDDVWGNYKFQEKRRDFFYCLEQCRHDAIYRNQGFDSASFDSLRNDKEFSVGSEVLNTQTRLIQNFASEFFNDSLEGVKYLLNNISITKKIREFLLSSIYHPPFDDIKVCGGLKDKFDQIIKIENWFLETRPKNIR